MTRRALSIALLLSACAGAPTPADDAAVTLDAVVAPDASVVPDSGTICGTLPPGRHTPLPATCLPRCTAATFTAYRACNDVDCIDAALGADPTPPALVVAGDDQRIVVGCGSTEGVAQTCLQWQVFAISAALCPDRYDAWAECENATGTTCDTENDAMIACAEANASFTTMFHTLVAMCFAAS